MHARKKSVPLVVLDTNILISHIWGSRTIDRIMKAMRDGFIVPVISPEILLEYNEVTALPKIRKRIPKSLIKRLERDLHKFSVIVKPGRRVVVCREDPDDNRILECAAEGNADYIVTGDPHLQRLGCFENIPILSPSAFAAQILPRIDRE